VYHLELRHSFHNLNRFNLQESQMLAIAVPWAQERAIDLGERKWSPHQAKLRILEGPQLSLTELSMGRGWKAATRSAQDVTDSVMARIRQELASPAPPAAGPAPPTAESGPTAALDAPAAPSPAVESPAPGDRHAGSAPPAQHAPADPIAVGVQLASLLGDDPAGLLARWQEVAARAPGLSPSESLAVAERHIS